MHHEIFNKIIPWSGVVAGGFERNFLGVLTRDYYFSRRKQNLSERFVSTKHPPFNEGYFEYIDILQAVFEAQDNFTMIELGAGWGKWLVNATIALRTYNDLPCLLIGVEAEPTHFKFMLEHFRDNGIEVSQHKLIEAAASSKSGYEYFLSGCSREWYGQVIVRHFNWKARWIKKIIGYSWKDPKTGEKKKASLKRVKSVSLNELLEPLVRVDLIDLDVQGSEFEILNSCRKQLNAKVKRIHIGTHGHDIELKLRKLFSDMNWKKINDYSCGHENDTPYGLIFFRDGVQTWVNPKP